MFATSVFIVMVIFSCVYHLTRRKKEKRKKEPFFSNRELLPTRKHWTINPSLAQAHHRHYRHIAFISFQLKISTPFRKLSTNKKKENRKKYIAFNSFFVSKYHFNFLFVKIMEKWYGMRSQDAVDIMHALKLSCMTTKYVFWSPIFPPQTTKLPPSNRSISST